MTNDLETPLFERGRADRTPIQEDWFDDAPGYPVNNIRVRCFKERDKQFITGIEFTHVDKHENSRILGELDLHSHGEWEEFRMEEGDQIIGIYGLQNNLIRGIGFILMNLKPSRGFFEKLKNRISSTMKD